MSVILLTGSTGKLGSVLSHFLKEKSYSLCLPKRTELDITNFSQTRSWVLSHDFEVVIHTAALARMGQCEENPQLAIQINMLGTLNLVHAILEKEKKTKKHIRFIHISTDGVYDGQKGNFSEEDITMPYNFYGWTKLGAEMAVQKLKNHCIIRTSFFDPQNIPFQTAATDVFSSRLPLTNLAQEIEFLIQVPDCGTFNVGDEKMSDFKRYQKFKKDIKPCLQKDILKEVSFKMAKDASLNCEKWKKIRAYV